MAPAGNNFDYPFAAAPDIIRSAEKDKFFQDVMCQKFSSVVQRLGGSSVVQLYASEARVVAEILYFSCTTLLGHRTLGEEYCDLVQVNHRRLGGPSVNRRASYILLSLLLPYLMTKTVPRFRAFLRSKLRSLLASKQQSRNLLRSLSRWAGIFSEINSGTSTFSSLFYGMSLVVFYFSGAYYHLSKRLLGLRYIFTKNTGLPSETSGYEVLGVLLLFQMLAHGWNCIKTALILASADDKQRIEDYIMHPESFSGDVSEQLKGTREAKTRLEITMQTSALRGPRYTLADPTISKWIQGKQQRKCTLCLEESKDPSVTTCGHIFCWNCINEWILEKPECPLCRQGIQAQHILPLR